MITFSRLGRYGQIGNQMFQIAGTVGIARKLGYSYAFPQWVNHDGLAKKNIDEEQARVYEWFKHTLPTLSREDINRMRLNEVPWGYHAAFRCSDWSDLIGHMQSEQWFKHCEEEIRTLFEFKEKAPQIKDKCIVHVRGGDYDGVYHNRLTADHYRRAFDIMRERGINKFVVFTDDTEQAKKVTGLDAVSHSDPMFSLWLMSGYKNHIIANSSFSWWGAWLSGSENVIAPAQWVGHAAKIDTRDIVPDRWTKI